MIKAKIGIDLGGTKVLIVANNLEEKVKTGIDFTPSQLETIIHTFIKENDLSPIGIGIAVPGLLIKNGTIISCDVLPNFEGWNAKKAFKKINTTVKTINDVKSALAQEFHDCNKDFNGGIIMVGTAVGAAFIINGKPLLGESGYAGEFGYFPLIINDEIKRIDEVCGGYYLAKQLEITSIEMFNLAMAGDERVLKVIEKGGYYLGIAIAGLINIFNPTKISVGGGSASLPLYWEGIVNGVKENVIPEFWNDKMLNKVKDDYKVAALGALRIL